LESEHRLDGTAPKAYIRMTRNDRESTDREVVARLQEGQGLAYRFLARCFHAPVDEQWLSRLARERMFDAWPFPSTDEDVAVGLSMLQTCCLDVDAASVRRVEWDFNRLFVGPENTLAPPWESVHRSKTGLTFQESTLEVRTVYEQFGLEAPAMHREPDDHIALELAFLAHVSEETAAASRHGDVERCERCGEVQASFLRDHLLEWVPACLTLVQTHAKTDFYRGVACLTRGTLATTADTLRLTSRGSRSPVANVWDEPED